MPLHADDRGGAAILGAVILSAVLMLTVLVVDCGAVFAARKRAQAAADAAALSAAYVLPNRAKAAEMAAAALQRNLPGAVLAQAPEFGTYRSKQADASGAQVLIYPVSQRFQAHATQTEAVRVATGFDVPLYFAPLLGINTARVGASAAAGRQDPSVSLAIGSGLAELKTQDSLVLNALLGSLLGSSVDLSLVHYRGLVDTKINALSFLDALATDLSLSAGDYDKVLASEITVGRLLQVAATTVAGGEAAPTGSRGAAIQALLALNGLLHGGPSLKVADILRLDLLQALAANPDGTRIDVDLLTFVTAAVQAANGKHGLSVEMPLTLPGLSLRLLATVVEAPQVAAKAVKGTLVKTAQMRLRLVADLGLDTGSNPVTKILGSILKVRVPIYIELASGSAQVLDIACTGNRSTPDSIDLRTKAGLLSAWIADTDASAVTDPVRTLTPRRATLAAVDLAVLSLTISGYANASAGQTTKDVTVAGPFSPARTVSMSASGSGTMFTNLLSSLDLDVQVKLLGVLGVTINTSVLKSTLIDMVLNAVAPVLNVVTDNLLQALGIKLGVVDTIVSNGSCGSLRVVQ